MNRAARGSKAYLSGVTAEEVAERLYLQRGAEVLARRMRNEGGEIDLIVSEREVVVFVEVKARKRREDAAYALSSRQMARLSAAAELWMAAKGRTGDMRFDVVLVDGQGAAEIIENALSF
ncbi:YraN family protein [Algicella marina]|uniref:UPF0102 protein GO499_12450 n=1 Tax=Algicella marina TaxID=2683284 RepID=A0A6P1T2E5_9RHOB|nr:YraN family protein [Algicella marina]QHQ35925.1 hypothetical protein GO499_12450 [Algicella marina]